MITDPDLAIVLPIGWNEMSIPNYRTLVESSGAGSSQAMRTAMAAAIRDIDAGTLRLVAAGPGGFGRWSATMTLQVEEGDTSLEAAIARIEKRSEGLAVRISVDERAISLAIGEGSRRVSTYALDPGAGGVPSRVVEYVVRLADSRTLWVMATAPEVAEGFDVLIDRSVRSIRTP